MNRLALFLFLVLVMGSRAQNPEQEAFKKVIQDKFVIVLDIQKYYTEKAISDSEADTLIKYANYVIENTDPNNVIYFKAIHKELTISFKSITVDTLDNLEIDSHLKVVNDNILWKEEGNALTVDELNNFLEKRNAKEIIVIGLMAEKCVYKTLIGGRELGYEMYVIPEAIVGKSEKSKQKVIEKLLDEGITIIEL